MKQETFEFLCEKLGDPSLPVDERWKSIQYIHIHSSYEPMGSFQEMLKHDRIYYYADAVEPGFVYTNAFDSAHDMVNKLRDDGKDYSISFLPISAISEITFRGWTDYENGDKIYGVNDIMNVCFGVDTGSYPTYIQVVDDIVTLADISDWTPKIKCTRYNDLTKDNFDIKYYDKLGNEVSKENLHIGEYTVSVTCKEPYVGSAKGKLSVRDYRGRI